MPNANKYIEGYRRFRDGYYQENKESLQELSDKGQFPKLAIVSCCDSRVEPSLILNCDPGDLFVIRNVANMVSPFEADGLYHSTAAALEFAVGGLGVENIVVMGHSQCGGIKALVDTENVSEKEGFVFSWMKQLEKVRNEVVSDESLTTPQERYCECEKQGVLNSLDNLMTFEPIKSRVESGELMLHGWYYDLQSSQLFAHDKPSNSFKKVI